MKSMGWKPGDGLGKDAAGIVAPIEVTKRADRAGLGGVADTVSAVPWSTLKETSKLKTRARFEDLEANSRQTEPQPPLLQQRQQAPASPPSVGREEGLGGLGLGM